MHDQQTHDRVVAVRDLRDYFRQSVDTAIEKQRVEINPHAAHYVVNLLTLYSRSDELYEDHGDAYGLKPLATMMVDATEASCLAERNCSLQRLGDVALFISGFFADGLADNVVDLDYYIAMGGSAYSSLSVEMKGSVRARVFAGIYRELADKFQVLVDVLNDVRDGACEDSGQSLLRTYEVWLKTGSKRAARKLRSNGVVPISDSVSTRRH
jgi:hypothetical protein